MANNVIGGNATVQGNLSVNGNLTVAGNKPSTPRSSLTTDELKPYEIPLTECRVHDAITSFLPSAGANDDLGLVGGTYGTDAPTLQTGDLKAAGSTTRYARLLVPLPVEYVDGLSVTMRITAGMETTVADTAATVDVEAYESDAAGGLVGSDICATAAQSINSLTYAQLSFEITPTTLTAGDLLDVRIAVLVNDGATGTAVIGSIGSITLLCDVRG